MMISILPWLSTLLVALLGGLAYAFKHQTTKAQIATVQSDASARVAAANSQRDQAITAIAEVRDSIAQGNADASQKGLDAVQERTNVDEQTRTANHSDNVRWMQEHGFVRKAESGSGTTGVATGQDRNAPGPASGSGSSNTNR